MEDGNCMLDMVIRAVRCTVMTGLFFTVVVSCASADHSLLEKSVVVSTLCEQFHARAYFILRVKKAVQFLRHYAKNSTIDLTHVSINTLQEETQCEVLRTVIDELVQTQSIKPLLRVWQDIASYHSLEDQVLTQEFARIMVLIMAHIVAKVRSGAPCVADTIPAIYEQIWSMTYDDQLTYVCYYTACVMDDKEGCFYQGQPEENKQFLIGEHVVGGGYTESITCRLYYQKRLARVYKTVEYYARNDFIVNPAGADLASSFSHPRMVLCMQNVGTLKSLKPLVELWGQFKEYHFINDDLFLREFLIATVVLVSMVKDSLDPQLKYGRSASVSDMLFRVYDKIYALPLEEILSTIDLLAQELPVMIQTYRPDCSLEWSEWVKKYCWSMPIDCIRVTIKVLLKFKDYMRPPVNHMFLPMPMYDNNNMPQYVPIRK